VIVRGAEGLVITADVHPHPASSTGLNPTIPAWVQEGYFADIVVFDPGAIQDRTTCEEPHK
jgi:hypothetical protein